jgi:hypothetical protein
MYRVRGSGANGRYRHCAEDRRSEGRCRLVSRHRDFESFILMVRSAGKARASRTMAARGAHCAKVLDVLALIPRD